MYLYFVNRSDSDFYYGLDIFSNIFLEKKMIMY